MVSITDAAKTSNDWQHGRTAVAGRYRNQLLVTVFPLTQPQCECVYLFADKTIYKIWNRKKKKKYQFYITWVPIRHKPIQIEGPTPTVMHIWPLRLLAQSPFVGSDCLCLFIIITWYKLQCQSYPYSRPNTSLRTFLCSILSSIYYYYMGICG